ncbi:TetR/AcrR family transcriptional regulator [Nonomuraea sp. NPDC050540]|uniref:TetR/AcrR family transcriptional regulator n=1 Tax=Nonomuraea sp. NPDC050540 TaxID=3364367 RepID=UPI0037B6AAE8
MPKWVDHDERRRHIAEAVLSIAGRDGLDRATLRDVAHQARISLGSVQHYFHTKDDMLRYVVGYLGEQVTARIVAGTDFGAEDRPVLAFLRSLAAEILPLDARRTSERRTGQALAARAPGAPELVEVLRENSAWLHARVAELITRAQLDGQTPAHLDAEQESIVLLALLEGLAADILHGVREPGQALASAHYHLDRLFTTG